MNDGVCVRMFERGADLDRDVDDARQISRLCLRETRAGDEFHDKKRQSTCFADVVDRDDMRMIERGGGACFANQALASVGGMVRGGQYLDRDFALELEIGGAIDSSHPTAPKLAIEPIALAQDVADQRNARAQL